MGFAFAVIDTVRREEPELFSTGLEHDVRQMMEEAIQCETAFAEDLLSGRASMGLSSKSMRQYLEFIADQRFAALGMTPVYRTHNPFTFMDLQDVPELTNFFERRVASYQLGMSGEVAFDESF